MSQPQVAIARKESSEETLARGRRRKDKKVPGAIPDSSSGSTICDDETILRELVRQMIPCHEVINEFSYSV